MLNDRSHVSAGHADGQEKAMAGERRYPWKGYRLGRLIVTVCNQGGHAPLVCHGWTFDQEGNDYSSKVILLTPWKRDSFGERLPQRALVIGWRES